MYFPYPPNVSDKMKINERSLSDFASFSDGTSKEGFLEKKGELNSSYKRRWFCLKGNLLFYFEKPGDKQPLGVIIVENCTLEVHDGERFAFCIQFPDIDTSGSTASKRTHILCAESEIELTKWMKAISSSSYAYMEMVVKQFEETVERLKSETEPESLDVAVAAVAAAGAVAGVVGMDQNSEACGERIAMLRNNKLSSSMKVRKRIEKEADDLQYLLPGPLESSKRSKSSENLSKLSQLARSPQFLRKKRDAMKDVPVKDYNRNDMSMEESGLTTFEHLHNKFGAAIWTKILT